MKKEQFKMNTRFRGNIDKLPKMPGGYVQPSAHLPRFPLPGERVFMPQLKLELDEKTLKAIEEAGEVFVKQCEQLQQAVKETSGAFVTMASRVRPPKRLTVQELKSMFHVVQDNMDKEARKDELRAWMYAELQDLSLEQLERLVKMMKNDNWLHFDIK